ncbi:SpoIIE family protein phosphatase [Streptomyces hilarionis]|uniref:SpoIIE family protein phosphatase n=1 Tax=Streptomyces hilarionis TaxID=2839954 RepID=UPI00211A8218|nr:SpoIIE family protein phosphatase [Streptomyces hilarionis]MCQ9132980.1 SpoIIE family protein phosphatase [Streptomyces hilarionis]
MAALTRVVARQRAEMDRLQELAAASAVLERAKGALMAQSGCSPDAAQEELQQRAKTSRRTLLEECWTTLGALAGPSRPDAAPAPAGAPAPGPAPVPFADEVDATALGRLSRALLRVGTPQDLALRLLDHLAPDVGADAVMIYTRRPGGGLELLAHAGVDAALADQWSRVPPVSGLAALDALRADEPRWLEDPRKDAEHYLLIGDQPQRWHSRAWLPVTTGGSADVALGILRRCEGPFTARVREHLLAVAQLCAGPLRTFAARRAPALGAVADAVQTVFDRLPVAAVLLAPLAGDDGGRVEDFRVDAATGGAFDALGRSGRDLVGLRFLECWPEVADEPLWQGCLRALADDEPYESEPFARQQLVAGSSELSTYTARAARLGDGLVVSWVRYDPSDRQQQRLADVQRLGNLGWATWNLVTGEGDWSSQVFAIFERDPAQGVVPLQALPRLGLNEDVPLLARAVGELVRHGRPCDVPFRIVTRNGVRHLRMVAEAMPDAHGAPAEVHGFVQDLTVQRNAELALVASERAMLTQHGVLQAERTVAARLQDALLPLPKQPVELAGLRVDIAYLPAQAGLNVGGDWFSAIELPDGDALFVVGDVAGHGMGAVAAMALLRFTAKGMIITGSSLTGALSRLNALLLHSRDPHGSATMVMARYSPRDNRLVWAQAGHPPPLLVRDGEARYLERPYGMLLGATDAPRYEEAEVVLEPGDRLLLYTDGLVERPAESIDLGLERLADAAGPDGPSAPAPLKRLLGALLDPEGRDDVCVCDIQLPRDGER